jgi:hypothetical protein
MQFFETGDMELYDLESDIAESTNIALSHPELVSELSEDLSNWQAKTNAAIPVKPNLAFDADAEKVAIEKSNRRKRSRNKK